MLATTSSFNPRTFVTTLHFCYWCRQHTRHELSRSGIVCLVCSDRAMQRELDRD